MNYEELEQRYDAFLAHEKFPEIKEHSENWSFNKYFLHNFLKEPSRNLTQDFKHYTILVNDHEIVLDLSKAPNFTDRDAYLSWLHTELNK